MRAKYLCQLNLDCAGFEVETVMNARAAKARLVIQEIPGHGHPRLQVGGKYPWHSAG
jgi:hypothetical protein